MAPTYTTIANPSNPNVIPGVVFDWAQLYLAGGNNSGNSTLVISSSIPVNTPAAGTIRVSRNGGATEDALSYTSRSGSTFNLSGTLPVSYNAGNMCHVVGTSKIIIPDNVGSINSLQLYDTVASQAQDGSNGSPGQAYPSIVEAGGKIQIGVGSYTGVITSLLGDWKIVTAKTFGSFTVTDIYIKGSSDEPFDRIAGVAYSWEKTVNPTLQTISTGSGLSATQDSWLAALYATLQAAGVFSTAALANAPSGGGGGGFTSGDRADLTEIKVNTAAIKIKTDQLTFSGGNLNARVMVLDSAAIAQTVTAVDSSTKLSRMFRELGGENGVSATVLDAQDGVPGYLRTSAGDRKLITKNPDGSVTISLDESVGETGLYGVVYDYFFS